MKLLLGQAILIGICPARVLADSSAVVWFDDSPQRLSYATTETAGWTFTPLVVVTVTSLGCWTNSYLFSENVLVGLWDDTGNLLASQTVSNANSQVDKFNQASIAPIVLSENRLYHIGVCVPNSYVVCSVTGGLDSPTMNSVIKLGEGVTSQFGPGDELTFPNHRDNSSAWLGPNFEFQVIPEPGAGSLFGISGLLLGFAFRFGRIIRT